MRTTLDSTQAAVAARKPLATVLEVATYCSVSRSTVYGWMEAGVLPFVKLGKSRRLRWEDVEALVAKNLSGSI
jgi:excisionase family DNA binding protein